jgi:hypothetical protein
VIEPTNKQNIRTDISELGKIELYYRRETYFIYSIVNLDNGKRYIGRTKNPRQRIYQHFADLKRHKHSNSLLNKDSDCRFGYEILEENVPFSQRTNKEREYMLRYQTYKEEYGYNAKDRCLLHLKDN